MAARTVWCRACGSRVPFSLQGCASCGAGLLRAGETIPEVAGPPPEAESPKAMPTRRRRQG
jgi:hypothetical protein